MPVADQQLAEQLALIRDLDLARIQGRQWRDETRALLKGLGEAIDRQFLTWKLTEAERDVGLLILKGLSLKEIAAARVTSAYYAQPASMNPIERLAAGLRIVTSYSHARITMDQA